MSLILGHEECRFCQTAAVNGPEELKPVDKTHSNTVDPGFTGERMFSNVPKLNIALKRQILTHVRCYS